MISSASTLLLATLVFNAASVLGAPVRIPAAPEVVVRAEVNEPVLPRVEIVDVQPQHRRSTTSGTVNRRAARLPRESAPENDIRDTASETVEIRDSLPEVERITRRYPRRALHDFYERRSEPPSHPAPREPAEEPQVKRRYPRRVYHDFFERRSEPPQPEAREEPSPPQEIQRRYPRRALAEHYEKRSSPPAPREPTPDTPVQPRRFPRAVYAEYYEKRQTEGEGDPTGTPAKPEPSPAKADPSSVVPTSTASATSSGSPSPSPAASSGVPAPIVPATKPIDVNAIVQNITSHNNGGFQPGTTIKETTVVINKVTHVSDTKDSSKVVQCNSAPSSSSSSSVKGSSTAIPSSAPTSSSTASSSSAPSSAPTGAPTPVKGDSTSPAGGPTTTASASGGEDPAAATASPSPSGTSSSDGAKPTGTTPEGEGTATPSGGSKEGGDGTARRSLAGDKATSQPIARRTLGFSGAAWASSFRRSVNSH